MLDAFEARLKPNQIFEERLRAYPDPQLETKSLEIFQKMIEGTQALLQRQTGHLTAKKLNQMGVNKCLVDKTILFHSMRQKEKIRNKPKAVGEEKKLPNMSISQKLLWECLSMN